MKKANVAPRCSWSPPRNLMFDDEERAAIEMRLMKKQNAYHNKLYFGTLHVKIPRDSKITLGNHLQ